MLEESPASARTARLRALTVNHRIAPLEALERVALSPAAAQQLCGTLLARGLEAVALSTCHRTELYWESRDARHDALAEATLRATVPGAWPSAAACQGRLRGEEVTRHLLRVAAGLESVLLGEAEVVGQIRSAIDLARAAGMRAPVLVELFRDALHFGRLARSRTRIGEGALSVASAAVHLLRSMRQDLSASTVLVVGAGKVGQKVVRHLVAERAGRCVLLNRTLARAQAAAEDSGVIAAPLAELPGWLAKASAVVVAAQAEGPLLSVDLVRRACEGRAPGSLVIMDASMPRAVDPAVARIPAVRLQDLSGLEALVQENRARREAEIPRVEALLEELLCSRERREQRRLTWERGIAAQERAG
jgi:glutamyl-tRNA reductase